MAIDKPPIGTVIASRQYSIAYPNGKVESAMVCIGQPVEAPEGGHWRCPYEIACKSFARTFYSAGEDSMQALILATHILATEIESLAKDHGVRFLLWEEDRLGLPHISDVKKM